MYYLLLLLFYCVTAHAMEQHNPSELVMIKKEDEQDSIYTKTQELEIFLKRWLRDDTIKVTEELKTGAEISDKEDLLKTPPKKARKYIYFCEHQHEKMVFKNVDDFKIHLEGCDQERLENEYPYPCIQCNNRFTTQGHLIRHQKNSMQNGNCTPRRYPRVKKPKI